jgi:hypothetical protein
MPNCNLICNRFGKKLNLLGDLGGIGPFLGLELLCPNLHNIRFRVTQAYCILHIERLKSLYAHPCIRG